MYSQHRVTIPTVETMELRMKAADAQESSLPNRCRASNANGKLSTPRMRNEYMNTITPAMASQPDPLQLPAEYAKAKAGARIPIAAEHRPNQNLALEGVADGS